MKEYRVTEVISGSPLSRSDKTFRSYGSFGNRRDRRRSSGMTPRGVPSRLPPRELVWAVLRVRGNLLSILTKVLSPRAIASARADCSAGEGRPERSATMPQRTWQVDCRFRQSRLAESRIRGCRCRLLHQTIVIPKLRFVSQEGG